MFGRSSGPHLSVEYTGDKEQQPHSRPSPPSPRPPAPPTAVHPAAGRGDPRWSRRHRAVGRTPSPPALPDRVRPLPPSTPPPCAGIPAGAVATAPRAARTVTTPARPAPVATLRAGLRAAAHARGWQPYERLGAPGPQGGPACALDLDLFLRRSIR